jgi:hypothetical protein
VSIFVELGCLSYKNVYKSENVLMSPPWVVHLYNFIFLKIVLENALRRPWLTSSIPEWLDLWRKVLRKRERRSWTASNVLETPSRQTTARSPSCAPSPKRGSRPQSGNLVNIFSILNVLIYFSCWYLHYFSCRIILLNQFYCNIVLNHNDICKGGHHHRCTAIFKFSWGGTWGCEKIWKGVLFFRVLLHFYVTIFQSLLRGYMRWRCHPSSPWPPLCASMDTMYSQANIKQQWNINITYDIPRLSAFPFHWSANQALPKNISALGTIRQFEINCF